jgi:hypothetical protein
VIHDKAAEPSLEMPAAFLQEMTRSKQASKQENEQLQMVGFRDFQAAARQDRLQSKLRIF